VVKAEKDDEQYQQWLAKEDDFMLVQAKKRAVIRVREGREKPIDALVINLNLIEGKKQQQRVLGDDEFEADGGEFYITEPDELIKVRPLLEHGR
jgi:Conserved mid region of cactin